MIAFSLYGNSSRYRQKIATLVKQVKVMYPGWTIRFYHDESISQAFLYQIECLKNNESLIDNTMFCDINKMYLSVQDFLNDKTMDLKYIHGMLWRYLPFGDHFVDIVSSQDAAARL